MRAVIQRVGRAAVSVGGEEVSKIGTGVLVFLGVAEGDGREDVLFMVRKITELRIFEDEKGKMNHALGDVGGEVLVVSQFTLLADCRRGRRPAFTGAAPPAEGERLYKEFLDRMRERNNTVKEGVFGAMMVVTLENDGPVTFVLDSRR